MKLKNKILFVIILGVVILIVAIPLTLLKFNPGLVKHLTKFYKYSNAVYADRTCNCTCEVIDARTQQVISSRNYNDIPESECDVYRLMGGGWDPAKDYDCYTTSCRGGSNPGGGGGGPEPDPEPEPEPEPEPDPEPVEVIINPTKDDFCQKIKENYNTKATNCSAAAIDVDTTNFRGKSPHITLANGLMLYIAEFDTIEEISDSNDEKDRQGFILFIDVDGSTGKSTLYEDVFPYYLTVSGKVIPGYKDSTGNHSGAANKDHLSMNVIYDNYSGNNREIKLLMKDSNFKRAACTTGYVRSSKYCDGNVQYNLCKKQEHDCRFIINKPWKVF